MTDILQNGHTTLIAPVREVGYIEQLLEWVP